MEEMTCSANMHSAMFILLHDKDFKEWLHEAEARLLKAAFLQLGSSFFKPQGQKKIPE